MPYSEPTSLAIVACPGGEAFADEVITHLKHMYKHRFTLKNDVVSKRYELTKEELYEFKEVLEDTEFLLKISYGRPNILIWENGTGNGGIGKAKDSVVHAHVHLAPSTLTSETIKIKSGFQFECITLDDISNYSNHSYLLIREENPNKWIINNSKELYIPRQYVRQLLAEENNTNAILL